MGQDDDRLPGTSISMTDVAMVPPILTAGLRSGSYKTKRSDRSLIGVMLEIKKPRQCGESTLKDFKLLCMGHRKSSVKGQLTPVEQ